MLQNFNLLEVAKQFPDMSITIKLEDLMEANRSLITEFLQQEAEEREKYAKEENYITREKVMEILGVSPTTLWRWEKTGYLVPFSIGTKRRYRKSEVDKIFQRELEENACLSSVRGRMFRGDLSWRDDV